MEEVHPGGGGEGTDLQLVSGADILSLDLLERSAVTGECGGLATPDWEGPDVRAGDIKQHPRFYLFIILYWDVLLSLLKYSKFIRLFKILVVKLSTIFY